VAGPVYGTEAITLANRRARLLSGAQLDFGGIGKGWAADTLVRRFGAASVLFDVGGDIAVGGPRADGSAWPIAVHDPLTEADSPLALLLLERGGIATSGRDYRQWRVGDRAVHHIIDPRTGAPAVTDVLAATVIAPTAVGAEVAAKVVLIQGSARGLEWLEKRPELAGLIVCENGEVRHSARWSDYDWSYKNRTAG
jgi:thiamine biosynthesis lipoprotein